MAMNRGVAVLMLALSGCASSPPVSKIETAGGGPTAWSTDKVKSIQEPSGKRSEDLGHFRGTVPAGSLIEYESGVKLVLRKDGEVALPALSNIWVGQDGAVYPGRFAREFD